MQFLLLGKYVKLEHQYGSMSQHTVFEWNVVLVEIPESDWGEELGRLLDHAHLSARVRDERRGPRVPRLLLARPLQRRHLQQRDVTRSQHPGGALRHRAAAQRSRQLRTPSHCRAPVTPLTSPPPEDLTIRTEERAFRVS